MLSSFLTEDLFKKGVAVSTLGQPWGCVSPAPAVCPRAPRLPQGFSGRGWGAPASPSPWPFFPQSYLHTFAYNNTVYLDLWNHLQKVSKSQLPAAIFGGS